MAPAVGVDRAAAFPLPVVVGVGRSGTTLLRLMLDAHPQVAIPAETGFLLPLFEPARRGLPLSPDELGAMVTGFHTWRDLGVPAELFRRELSTLDPFSISEGVRLFYRLYARRRGKPRAGDKTPIYGQHLQAIEAILPEAHFLHLIRDGRDVALSLRGVWFAPGQDVESQARLWVSQVEETRRAGACCRRYLELRYEDLVLDTREVLRAICRFLALPFAAEMETYHATARERLGEVQDAHLPDGRTVSRGERLRQHARTSTPPDPTRLGRWRSEMSAAERREFERLAGRLLRELGYEVEDS